MARPTISVLLPVRDAEGSLDEAIRSVHEQTFRDWECLVIDDRSTDASPEVAAEWARQDGRFRPVSAGQGAGIVAALEAGRALVRGEFIARQDADDRSLPRRFEVQLSRLRGDPRIAAAGCRARVPGPRTAGMERYLAWLGGCIDPETIAREIWIESPIVHPTAMARAEWLERVGGYRDVDWPEDYDLWLRIHRAGGLLTNVDEVLYEWRDHPERLSRRDGRYGSAAFLRCRLTHLRRWFGEQGVDGRSRPLVVWGAGRDGRRLAAAWEMEIAAAGPEAPRIEAFVDIDPRKIGRSRRGGLPVLAFEDARRRLPAAIYLAAVGVEGARELIRAQLAAAGLREGTDFVCLH